MSVSTALEKSARDFGAHYTCKFNFNAFEKNVEELTFLRPVDGWTDVYKTVFEKMYMQALESATTVDGVFLDGEAMLDDFEYTLIRPYVNEDAKEINHTPYVGMDRVSRLEYLQQLTKRSPSNFVDLYAKKYKDGELSIKQMRSKLNFAEENRENCIEMAGFVQALETVNKSRSLIWRVFHPFKNSAEKSISRQLKRTFIEQTQGGEEYYTEASKAAYETFNEYQRLNACLEDRMKRAREDLNITRKMNEVIRESLHLEGFDKESEREFSPRVNQQKNPAREFKGL